MTTLNRSKTQGEVPVMQLLGTQWLGPRKLRILYADTDGSGNFTWHVKGGAVQTLTVTDPSHIRATLASWAAFYRRHAAKGK